MNREIAQYIRASIRDNSMNIKYQPQFCTEGDYFKITGVEALLRPDTSVCHIDKLIRVAVDTDQMIDLGYWVMRRACHQLRSWVDENLVTSTFSMSVNVSAEQLQDKHFCTRVLEVIQDTEIKAHQLTLELTETSMINDLNIAKIYQLSTNGVNISIDDFGTGYSSLGRLKLLPIHEIKIDKTFVDDVTKTEQDIALITAMYQLTKALNKFTIVEGVENTCQYNILRDIGFTCFQGYYFCKAETAEEIEETITLINSLHCQ